MNWTTAKDIVDELQRRWHSGQLPAMIVPDVAVQCGLDPGAEKKQLSFPHTQRFRKPGPHDFSAYFEQVQDWICQLEGNARNPKDVGYEIVWSERTHRLLGRNKSPQAIRIPTLDDALALTDKTRQAKELAALAKQTLGSFPELAGWLCRKPLVALKNAQDWPRILNLLAWFRSSPRPNLYMRQIDLPGIDSKFIEQRKSLLSQLLDETLPKGAIDQNCPPGKQFEARYGLASKPPLVRFRLLDPRLNLFGLSDLSVRADEFARLDMDIRQVFIIENEITGLAFPGAAFPVLPKAIVIFGLGYAVDLLTPGRWLQKCELHYWSDLDTHGFAMLDRLRASFPAVRSLLMDRATLLACRPLWSSESAPHIGDLCRLTPDENQLYNDLRFDRLALAVRLEQEHIPFTHLTKALEKISP